MPQVNAAFVLTKFSRTKDSCTFKARLPQAGKPARKLDKWGYILIRVGDPKNLYLHLARDGYWEWNWITVSSSSADLHLVKWEPHSFRVSTQNRVACKHGLCDRDDAVVQISSLIQNRLAFRKNLRAISSLKELSGIPKLIEEDSGSSVPALSSGSRVILSNFIVPPIDAA